MIYAVILMAASDAPSNASTELVLALIALAGTLSLAVGGVIQAFIARQRREEAEKVRGAKEKNVETKFEEVDSQTGILMTRLAFLDRENASLKERIASLEGRSAEQSEELRYRNEKIDQLTRELAVWQYKWERLEEGTGGQGGSSGS